MLVGVAVGLELARELYDPETPLTDTLNKSEQQESS